MYIIMLASECAPVAKVGGLADVVFGLSRELEIRGNAVEIILPKYDCMRYDHIWNLQKTYEGLKVPWHGGAITCSVWFGFVHGRKCFVIEAHSQENGFNPGACYRCWDVRQRMAFIGNDAVQQSRPRVFAQDQQKARGHPLSRLADRAGAGNAL